MLSSDSEDDAYEAPEASNGPLPHLEIQAPMALPDSRGIIPPPDPVDTTPKESTRGARGERETLDDNYVEIVDKQHPVPQLPRRKTSKASNRDLTRQSSSNFNAYSDISQDISRHERYSLYVLLTRCAAMPFSAIRQVDDVEKLERVLTVTHFEHIRSRFVNLLRGEFIMRRGDKVLAELLQTFFNECLRSYHILRLVRLGGLTLTDLREIFATRVDKEIEKMGFKEVSLADQVKHKYMEILNRLLDENLGNKKTIKGGNFNKDHMLSEIRLILNIRNQIHRKLCHLMLLDRPMKLQGLVEAELKERFQVEHEVALFNMPLNWADNEMDLEIERELENQTKELLQNFRTYMGSMENKTADDQESEANKYISQINYRMRKTKGWVEDRTLILGGTSQEGSGSSTGAILPEIVITVSVDNVRNLGLHFTKSTCIIIVTLKRIGKKGQSKRFKMEKTYDPSVLEGTNEEATFYFGGPLPQIELALCSYRKEGPIGKSFAMIHTVGKTVLQLYPDKIEAHINEAKDKQIVYQIGTKRDITFNPKKKSLPPFTASVSISMAMPDNVKCTGEIYYMSKELTNGKWKKRYAILMESSRSNFVLSFYKRIAGEPADVIPLDRFVVDYLDFQESATSDVIHYPKIEDLPEGTESRNMCYFFATRSKFRIEMATVASEARDVWLDKLSSATRQTFKPEPPMNLDSSQLDEDELNIAELEEYSRLSFLSAEVDAHELYGILIKILLNFKLKDDYRSLGWFTAEQRLMIDEFCSRYAIRSTEKHFLYLKTLLKRAVEGDVIDPSLLHFAFVCTSSSFKAIKLPGMATSNIPDFLGFFTSDEFDCFYPEAKLDIAALVRGPMDKVTAEDLDTAIEENLTKILVSFLLNKISTFTTSYPFGKPKGLLESCFAFLERIMEETKEFESTEGDPSAGLVVSRAHVEGGSRNGGQKHSLSKEMMSPVVKMMVEKCMTKAAVNDFQKIMANTQDVTQFVTKASLDVPFLIEKLKEFLNKIIPHLQTTEIYFIQSFGSFPEFLKLYLDTQCYLLFSRLNDFFQLLPIDSWEIFEIYQILNTYFSESRILTESSFHQELSGLFVPSVIQYMAITEKSITESFNKNMAKELWVSEGASCLTSEDVFWKLYALRNFIHDLRWPQDEFNQHLNFRLMILAANSIDSVVKFAIKSFHSTMSPIPKSRKATFLPKMGVMMNVLTRADEVIGNLRIIQILTKLVKDAPPSKHYKNFKVTDFVAQGLETFHILLQQVFDGALNEQLNEFSKFDVKTTFIYSIYSFTVNLKSKVKNTVASKKDDEDSTDGKKLSKDKQKQKEEEQQQVLSITETAPLWLTKWLTTDPDAQTEEYDISTPYIEFLRNNIAAIRESVKEDTLIDEIFSDWYHSIIDQLLGYVNQRIGVQLDVVQINSTNSLLKRVYRAFLMENMKIKELESDNLKLLRSRLQSEERGAIRIGKGKFIKEFSGDSDDEDEEDMRKIDEMLR